MKKFTRWIITACFIAVCFIAAIAVPVRGQVALDGTMGAAGALSGPAYDIKAEYGQSAGANLFHSFSTFNIADAESATFNGPARVQNIISRVTGGTGATIDGKLASTIPGANLYLLNPAGILFGKNASLDIGGSFHASTADYLRLGDNSRFHSTPRQGEVLLAAAPTAFGYLDGDAASITLEGMGLIEEGAEIDFPTGLVVKENQAISLVGGDIEISGTYSTIFADATNEEPDAGDAGSVTISAAKLVVVDGGKISSETPPQRLPT